MELVTTEQMRRLDAATIAEGTPGLELMERAGRAVAELIQSRHREACQRGVLVVAGAGNNGGDGFVIARLLAEAGFRARVALLAPMSRVRGDAETNRKR